MTKIHIPWVLCCLMMTAHGAVVVQSGRAATWESAPVGIASIVVPRVQHQIGGAFVLNTGSVIRAASVEGFSYSGSLQEDFRVEIFSLGKGAVRSVVANPLEVELISRMPTGVYQYDPSVKFFAYDLNFTVPVELEPGAYVFSIYSCGASVTPDGVVTNGWAWTTHRSGDSSMFTELENSMTWQPFTPTFTLHDTRFAPVPEPSNFVLGVLGALIFFRRRRF